MSSIPFTLNYFSQGDPPAQTAPLDQEIKADVVIVGAGLVGLSCAYSLCEAGLDVALVEREYVGCASSGRHLGHVTPHSWDLGPREPQRLAQWAQGCVDELEKLVSDENIECEFARADFWMPAVWEKDMRSVGRAVEYYKNLGVAARLVQESDFDLVSYKTFGAMAIEDQARMDPYLFVRGMREAVLRKGVRLYEGTPVSSVESGTPVIIRTPGGTIQATKAILATNAYSGEFPFLRNYVEAQHVYSIVTSPLDDETAAQVGPEEARELMIFDYSRSAARPHFYQRFRQDGRLIFGGGAGTPPLAPDRLAPDDNQEQFQTLQAEMIRRYPALESIPIEIAWGGSVSGTATGLPILAELPDKQNIILAVVGNGNGVGLGTSAGRLVKGLVLGRDTLDGPTRDFLDLCRLPEH